MIEKYHNRNMIEKYHNRDVTEKYHNRDMTEIYHAKSLKCLNIQLVMYRIFNSSQFIFTVFFSSFHI